MGVHVNHGSVHVSIPSPVVSTGRLVLTIKNDSVDDEAAELLSELWKQKSCLHEQFGL